MVVASVFVVYLWFKGSKVVWSAMVCLKVSLSLLGSHIKLVLRAVS